MRRTIAWASCAMACVMACAVDDRPTFDVVEAKRSGAVVQLRVELEGEEAQVDVVRSDEGTVALVRDEGSRLVARAAATEQDAWLIAPNELATLPDELADEDAFAAVAIAAACGELETDDTFRAAPGGGLPGGDSPGGGVGTAACYDACTSQKSACILWAWLWGGSKLWCYLQYDACYDACGGGFVLPG